MTPQSNPEDEVWNQELAYWESLKAGDLDSYLRGGHKTGKAFARILVLSFRFFPG